MTKSLRIPVAFCSLISPARISAADTSNPVGTWYMNANNFRLAITFNGPATGPFTGSLINESRRSEQLDNISWDSTTRQLEFRRNGSGFWQWCRGRIVEGVFVGRFSQSQVAARPSQLSSLTFHLTGWNAGYVDQGLVPRAYDLVLNNSFHAILRIDASPDSHSGFTARLKVYANTSLGDPSQGEEAECDLEVTHWDGTNLNFVRRTPALTQTYTGTVSGRTISGTFTQVGTGGAFFWSGDRTQVLSYGFGVPKGPLGRAAWQERTRAQLYHLMMGDNPAPLSSNTTLLRSNVSPFPSTPFPSERDDNPGQHPQSYRLTELQFDYSLPNPYGGSAMVRRSHAYLAVPTTPAPRGGKYPAVLAVNGHGGSAFLMMDGTNALYWYGEAWARRGYVVLAVDISHRPLEDRSSLYSRTLNGDDPNHGNGAHQAIKAPGFDSDWEEDGERAWDTMRGLDYLLSRPFVDPSRVLVTGLSMGGEISTIVAALDPRLGFGIPAGYSPDLNVMLVHGNHPCWQWLPGNVREYVDTSDFHALIAPRPLIIETGKVDGTFSRFSPPFAADKQVLRRARAAYGGEMGNLIHYLHYDEHRYHTGDVNPTHSTEQNVRVPEVIHPTATWSQEWQTDNRTFALRGTLFDFGQTFLQMSAADTQDFEDDGSQRSFNGTSVHVCASGVMRGVDAAQNRFMCTPLIINSQVTVDTKAQGTFSYNGANHSVHVCPANNVMIGWHEANNWLICVPTNAFTGGTRIDGPGGSQELEPSNPSRSMHVCEGTNAHSAMVGIHAGDNALICRTVP